MADQLVYVDRFVIRNGELENVRRYAAEMAQLVHANQPEALSYHYYVDKQSGAGTAILRVFKDLPGVGWRHLYKKGGLENASATCCAAGSRPIGLAAVMNGTPHAKART